MKEVFTCTSSSGTQAVFDKSSLIWQRRERFRKVSGKTQWILKGKTVVSKAHNHVVFVDKTRTNLNI